MHYAFCNYLGLSQLSGGLDEINLIFILSFLLIVHSQALKLHLVYYQDLFIASPFYGSFFKHELV